MASDQRKQLAGTAEVIAACDRVDAQIAELRAAYDQYFLGLDRRPPTQQHKDLAAEVAKLRSTFVRHTGASFRIQAVQQKFTTYERLWNRTLQEMENGTYVRDLKRAAKRRAELEKRQAAEKDHGGKTTKDAPEKRSDADREDDDDFFIDEVDPEEAEALRSGAAFQTAPPSPPPAAPPQKAAAPVAVAPAPTAPTALPAPVQVPPVAAPAPSQSPKITSPGGIPIVAPVAPPAVPRTVSSPSIPKVSPPPARPSGPPVVISGSGVGGVSEDKLRAVYDAFVKAKKRCNEDVSNITFDTVAGSLRKQVPELMKKANARSVEFKVVIKDGKAILRAVPKE